MTLDELRTRATIDVPTAGREVFGLGVSASYAAARRGEIPTLRIGRKLVVPTAALLALVGQKVDA
jgi:hypothetical protein